MGILSKTVVDSTNRNVVAEITPDAVGSMLIASEGAGSLTVMIRRNEAGSPWIPLIGEAVGNAFLVVVPSLDLRYWIKVEQSQNDVVTWAAQ